MDLSLKRKIGQQVAKSFSRILKERKSTKTWVDKGREFYNKDVQNNFSSILKKTKKNLALLKDLIVLFKTKFFKYFLQIQLGNI